MRPTDALADALRAPPPPAIAELGPGVRDELAALVVAARRRQAAELQGAFDASLRQLPWPLRGVVRKMVLG